MATTNKNTPLLHRKEFQMMTPTPVATTAGSFLIPSDSGNFNNALFISSATVHYLYNHEEDAWLQIPSGALAGTFGAGACGVFHPWSVPYTATGGSTTSVTVAAGTHNITGRAVGSTIEFISASTASGFRGTITSILNNAGTGTITLNFTGTAPTAILNTHTFRLTTGRFFVMNAGTTAAGIFKVYDLGTSAWQANLSTTNLPASWGTDGKLVAPYNFGEIYATGTATSGTGTTLVNSGKTWTTNQWTNYQVRITAGTGVGQVRVISSNTATALTVPTWTTNPDATSVYVIECDENSLYLMGNNAVTMYKYNVGANTWAAVTPTTARAGAPVAGMTANAVGTTGDALWADESAILNGRYIYSLRAGGTAIIDRFDIAGGTAGAGAWAVVTTINTETFAAGTSGFTMGEFLYIRKDATNRFFKYSVVDNAMRPFTTNLFTDGAALLGNKLWVKNLPGSTDIKWVYSLQNSGTALHRILII